METTMHTEERHFRIGDNQFYVRLELNIDREGKSLEYWIKTAQGRPGFNFANSKPETARKIAALIIAAVNKVTRICKEEGFHIVLLSQDESGSSNGAQADDASADKGGL